MKKKLVFLPLITILFAGLFMTNSVISPTDPVVGTDPVPSTAPVGVTFDVNITITDAVNLSGWEFNITFDPTVLNVVTITEGPFLLDFAIPAGVYTWFVFDPESDIDNTNGWTHALDTLMPYPDPVDGADGSGVLATVTFSVVSKGMSDLQFVDPTMLRELDPITRLPVEIPHTTKDGFFQYPIGDVDGDGDVDGFDLTRMCGAYGLTPSDLGWDEPCDINKDDIIDGFDLTPACGNYGMNP